MGSCSHIIVISYSVFFFVLASSPVAGETVSCDTAAYLIKTPNFLSGPALPCRCSHGDGGVRGGGLSRPGEVRTTDVSPRMAPALFDRTPTLPPPPPPPPLHIGEAQTVNKQQS